ncbi:polymorphic toxin-type HINT domain-containing protein [Streptomyces sp. NPDC059153]|uniref:NucA/NucB deoxyribonuclease domain-containing protein n=1 Tax=Streptomyces sp. NPDC059153 TaxID=3346743 RepID=UPI0036C4A210
MELRLAKGATAVEATRYYSYAGQTIAVRQNDNKLTFLAADHHGTAELAIDATTQAVTQRRFDPYGVARAEPTGQWPGEKGFVGGTIDEQSGLTHLGAREYDPGLGKFISVDPVIDYTDPQQMNAYAYANNSPVTLSDPSGLLPCAPGVSEHGNSCGGGGCTLFCSGDVADTEAQVTKATGDRNAAQAQQGQAKQRIKQTAKALVKIVRDLIGVDAALDCFSSGDLGACGETLLNVAGSFAGGLAGKILAKYGLPWKWAKGVKLAKRVVGLVSDLIGGVKDLVKSSKALSKAQDALAVARAKAKAALSKLKKSDPTSCHSFLPGTKVLLADGSTKPIEKVKLGDKVVVTDPATGKTEIREAVGTIVTEDDKRFVDLKIAPKKGAQATLVATTTHPFWVVSENAWIDAGDLQPGMELRTAEGDIAKVEGVRHFEELQRTHDLTISDIHTYYVLAGKTPVLVHNTSCPRVFAVDSAGEATSLPVHEIDSAAHAPQATNFGKAIADGAPAILTRRSGGEAAARTARRQAQAHAPRPRRFASNATWEEYPFASSVEGGSGATLTLSPGSINSSHGWALKEFYKNAGINPGDQYAVRVR